MFEFFCTVIVFEILLIKLMFATRKNMISNKFPSWIINHFSYLKEKKADINDKSSNLHMCHSSGQYLNIVFNDSFRYRKQTDSNRTGK